MRSRMASTTTNLFLIFSILPLLTFVGANNDSTPQPASFQCPPPPPCICNPTPPLPQPNNQPPLPPPPTTQPAPPPNVQPPPPLQTTPPPSPVTTPPVTTPPSPSQKTPPPPPLTTPAPLPPLGGICSKNSTELQICANILGVSGNGLNTRIAEPCCSIIRNISDIDAVTCLCKSVGARPRSLSPNINIFFRTCGRRIPQGFICPGPSPTTSPPPFPLITPPPPPPLQTTPPPPSQKTPPPPPLPPSGGICSKNSTELQICANILGVSGNGLNTRIAEPCCSIIRNISDIDAVTCLCKSVGARPRSLSPNINIFFRTCGRRIPQGFSCPGPSPTTSPPPFPLTTPPPPPPLQTTPPPPSQKTPPPPPLPPSGGICSKNSTELQICANILGVSGNGLNTRIAEPCCSIIRNISDIDAVTCLCKSIGARPLSLSPNINIFFRTCGRRIPQGFSCPGPSPTTSPPPFPLTTPPPPPPLQTTPLPPSQKTPPPPPLPPSGGICSKNSTELQICANILGVSGNGLNTRIAEPCCSIIRNISDIDGVTCLCKSVGARPLSLSPNIIIFFRTCGRRIPQGFSCP